MKSLIKLLLISLALSSCAKPVPLPEGKVCRMNVKSGYVLCFNLETDFDENAVLLPQAKGIKGPLDLQALHGHWDIDEKSLSNIRAYGMKVKDAITKDCQK